jgi:hypothetical protein
MKKILKYMVAIPIAFLWDVIYNTIVFMYNKADKINDVGGKWLEDFIDKE